MHFRILIITTQKIQIKVVVGFEMTVGIHRQKSRMLQKARIDTSSSTWVLSRNSVDQFFFKPFKGFSRGEPIHLSW